VDEIAGILPDEECIAESGEDETEEDLAGVGVVLGEAESVEDDKDDEGDDGKAFDDAVEGGVETA